MRPSRARTLLVALCATVVVSVSSVARADDQAELEKGRAAFIAKNYDEAFARLSALLDAKKGTADPVLRSQARMFVGASLLAQGKKSDAALMFEQLLLDDSQFEPDPLTFPTDTINTFIDVRAKIRERLNAAAQAAAKLEAERRAREEAERKKQADRLKLLESMAAEEHVTVKHSRIVATIPFGVGQFQNGQPVLGWIFLSTEAALVIATAITVPIYVEAGSRASDEQAARDQSAANQYNDRKHTVEIVNWSLAGGLAATMVLGAVQAHLNFTADQSEKHTRPIPQFSAAPVVDAKDARISGATIGIGGSF